MKRTVLSIMLVAAGLFVLAACQHKEEAVPAGDGGPEVTLTYDASALMGTSLGYVAAIDDEKALKEMKVELTLGGKIIASDARRLNAAGSVSGTLEIPFEKNVPDGTGTLKVTVTNVQNEETVETRSVEISRPRFDYISVRNVDTNYQLRPDPDQPHLYKATEAFGNPYQAQIVTPEFGPAGDVRTLKFGKAGDEVLINGLDSFEFSSEEGDTYELWFNTLTFEYGPFLDINIAGVNAKADGLSVYAVASLEQGQSFSVERYDYNLADWAFDEDFLSRTGDNSFSLVPLSGLYKVILNPVTRYISVLPMADAASTATLPDGSIWMIGADDLFGKPAIFNPDASGAWTESHALPLSRVEANKHVITFVAGPQLDTRSMNVKLFHQQGWGGEFASSEALVSLSDLVVVAETDGNIHLADGVTLTYGGVYRFTADLSGYDGERGATLDFQKVGQVDLGGESIAVNGVALDQLSESLYAGVVSLTKGGAVTTTDGASFDSDYVVNGTFAAATGTYRVIDYRDHGFITFQRLNADGTMATLETGGLWMMGNSDNAGKPVIGLGLDWSGNNGIALAEVSDKTFQVTFKAGEQLSVDGFNLKLYGGLGWYKEFTSAALTTDSNLLVVNPGPSDDGNLFLVGGTTLEYGATYRFTVDLKAYDAAAHTGALLHFAKVGDSDVKAREIAVNGTRLDMVSPTLYRGIVPLTKGETFQLTGVDNLAAFWVDPDYVAGGKVNVVSGQVRVTVDLDNRYVGFFRVNADGSSPDIAQGGLYFLGWGAAALHLSEQPGWEPGRGVQLAYVDEHKFQFTAVVAGDGEPGYGKRLRHDWWGFKYFFQDGWGGEALGTIRVAGNAASAIAVADTGDLSLAEALEEGATYRFTIDFTGVLNGTERTDGAVETLYFDKL